MSRIRIGKSVTAPQVQARHRTVLPPSFLLRWKADRQSASTALLPCLGTTNVAGNPKRRSSGRTPKPGGSSGLRNQRASVLDCGGAPPLSTGERLWNSYGSWRVLFRFFACIGTRNLAGANVGQASRLPSECLRSSGKTNLPFGLANGGRRDACPTSQ